MIRFVESLDLTGAPKNILEYVEKSDEERREWLRWSASAEEWRAFLEAVDSLPEPHGSTFWLLYVAGPYGEEAKSRLPARGPRGSA